MTMQIENDVYSASILPNRGAKISSIKYKPLHMELLLQPEQEEVSDVVTDPSVFSVMDSFGFDDMVPTIDSCRCTDENFHEVILPDHGEVWALPWDCVKTNPANIQCRVQGKALPYTLSRNVSVSDDGLTLSYHLVNQSTHELPLLWAAHALFKTYEGMRLMVPSGMDSILTAIDSPLYGKTETTHPFPIAQGKDISTINPASGLYGKYYFLQPTLDGWCALDIPKPQARILVSFFSEIPLYLGVWMNEGGWGRQNTIGIEPATAAMDSPFRAKKLSMGEFLPPLGETTWRITISVLENLKEQPS
jgi:galactose mutarotase-like enzyme